MANDDTKNETRYGVGLEAGFATRQLHAGHVPDEASHARAVPIYASSSYVFESTVEAERTFAGEVPGNRYARVENPTTQALADRVASLEGRPPGSGVPLSSGQAATTTIMMGLSRPGATWLVSDQLFGGTASVAGKVLRPFGVTVKSVSPEPEAIEAHLDETVVGVWVETIANPSGHVPNLPLIAEVARRHGVPLVVDNTWGSGGYLCRPLELGADIVVHSATKWIGGHGVAIGGVVVDGGSFDWTARGERYPQFQRRDAHGRTMLEKAPDAPVAALATDLGLMTMGMTMAPHTAFLLLQGLETLDLRVQRACDSALHVAREFQQFEGIAEVVYPGLPEHPSHAVARSVLSHGFGSVMGLRFASEALARGTLDRFRLVSHLANIGDAKTVAIHPWTTTHASLTDDAKLAGGVTPDLIRFSVGLEDPRDLLSDVEQALAGARSASGHE